MIEVDSSIFVNNTQVIKISLKSCLLRVRFLLTTGQVSSVQCLLTVDKLRENIQKIKVNLNTGPRTCENIQKKEEFKFKDTSKKKECKFKDVQTKNARGH